MCQAVPAKVIEILKDEMAIVEMGGLKKTISLSLLENINLGDYVIVHVGFALNRINEKEAMRTLDLFNELNDILGK